MATFNCCFSGIEITTSHFPLYLSKRTQHTCAHPIFHVPQKSLLAYARKWSSGELTKIDSFLLYIALLKSTDLVIFRTPAIYVDRKIVEDAGIPFSSIGSDSIVAHNMEKLMIAISRINSLSSFKTKFPEMVIGEGTNHLWNSKHWIDSWNSVYQDHVDGIDLQESFAALSRREEALHKMIKSPHRKLSSYSKELAEWADEAAAFPTFLINDPFNDGIQMPLNEYYKNLIQAAAAKEFFRINKSDLIELTGMLEERIEYSVKEGQNAGGSIQSFLLFGILKDARKYLDSFIVSKTPTVTKKPISETWHFAEALENEDDYDDDETEFTPGLNAILDSVSLIAPVQKEFATKFEYIKAKIKWDAATTAAAKKA